MDYNFAACALWFFSCPAIIKAVGFTALVLALAGTALVITK